MSKVIHRAVTAARGATAMVAAVPLLFIGAGCAAPAACVGGIGVCKSPPIPPRYAIIDPSGSQAKQVGRQIANLRAIASRGPAEITIVLLGERPSTSKILTRVALQKIDESDPNAVATRTALLGKLEEVVRRALARHTRASDQWGALALVREDAAQRGVKPGFDVFVLGDSEPAVPGVVWTRSVPSPNVAVRQVQNAYGKLNYSGADVTFVVGGDAGASRKSPGYTTRLSAAVLAVCEWAGAHSCAATTHVAEASS